VVTVLPLWPRALAVESRSVIGPVSRVHRGFHGNVKTIARICLSAFLLAALPSVKQLQAVAFTNPRVSSDPAVVAASVGCGRWRPVASALGNIRLISVAAVGPDDVWAAGHNAAGGVHALVEHWDGTEWTKAHVPATQTWAGINGLAAISANDVWGVGFVSKKHAGLPLRPLAEHWDGAAWSIVPTPSPPGVSSSAFVRAADDGAGGLFAVGYAIAGEQRRTLVEHWDGAAWDVVPSPSPGTVANGLLDVIATSPSSAVAVGYRSDGAGNSTLVEELDDTTWSVVHSADPNEVDSVLAAVAEAPGGRRWATGFGSGSPGGSNAYRTLVEWRRTTGWREAPSANAAGPVNLLTDVNFASAGDGWAVGSQYSLAEGEYRPLIEHWDGREWTLVRPVAGGGTNERLRAVTTVPGTLEAWAVGSTGLNGLIEHYCPKGSTSLPAPLVTSGSRPPPSSEARGAPSAAVAADSTRRTMRPLSPTTPRPPPDGPVGVHAVDMAPIAGIGGVTRTYGAAVTDYDGDGWPDVAISGAKSPAHLYRNDGRGGFTEPNPGMFPDVYRLACSWSDVNLDGLADLFCGTSADSGTDLKANELWMQQPDHTFVDEAALFGVIDPLSRARRGVFADVNHDGYPDLWLGSDNERLDGLPDPNRLLINNRGRGFVDDPSYGLDVDSGATIGPVADMNGDGYEDLLTCVGGYLHLYRNDGGSGLTDVSDLLGEPMRLGDVWISDMNSDDRQDLVGIARNRLDILLQRPDGHFELRFRDTALVDGVAVAVGDVNMDTAPDVYVVQGLDGGANAPDLMLLNRGGTTGFTSMTVPETDVGSGDTAVPFDYDHNGLDDFLVLNGRPWPKEGPVQLIAFFRDEGMPGQGERADERGNRDGKGSMSHDATQPQGPFLRRALA
jgi:hypothetical protein